MSSAAARAGSNAMPRWLSRVRIGTSALRLPLIAPINPFITLLLVLEITSANSGSGTYWSSAESGGAMLGLIFA